MIAAFWNFLLLNFFILLLLSLRCWILFRWFKLTWFFCFWFIIRNVLSVQIEFSFTYYKLCCKHHMCRNILIVDFIINSLWLIQGIILLLKKLKKIVHRHRLRRSNKKILSYNLVLRKERIRSGNSVSLGCSEKLIYQVVNTILIEISRNGPFFCLAYYVVSWVWAMLRLVNWWIVAQWRFILLQALFSITLANIWRFGFFFWSCAKYYF